MREEIVALGSPLVFANLDEGNTGVLTSQVDVGIKSGPKEDEETNFFP